MLKTHTLDIINGSSCCIHVHMVLEKTSTETGIRWLGNCMYNFNTDVMNILQYTGKTFYSLISVILTHLQHSYFDV